MVTATNGLPSQRVLFLTNPSEDLMLVIFSNDVAPPEISWHLVHVFNVVEFLFLLSIHFEQHNSFMIAWQPPHGFRLSSYLFQPQLVR